MPAPKSGALCSGLSSGVQVECCAKAQDLGPQSGAATCREYLASIRQKCLFCVFIHRYIHIYIYRYVEQYNMVYSLMSRDLWKNTSIYIYIYICIHFYLFSPFMFFHHILMLADPAYHFLLMCRQPAAGSAERRAPSHSARPVPRCAKHTRISARRFDTSPCLPPNGQQPALASSCPSGSVFQAVAPMKRPPALANRGGRMSALTSWDV